MLSLDSGHIPWADPLFQNRGFEAKKARGFPWLFRGLGLGGPSETIGRPDRTSPPLEVIVFFLDNSEKRNICWPALKLFMVLVHVILMATECPSWSSFVLGLSICRNLRLFFESTNRALLCTLVFHPLLFASASTRKPSRLPHEYTCVIQLLSSCRNSPNSIHSNQKLHSASPCPNLPPNLQISFSAWPQVGPSLFTPRGAFHARGSGPLSDAGGLQRGPRDFASGLFAERSRLAHCVGLGGTRSRAPWC